MLKLNTTKQLPLLNQSISSVHKLLKNKELSPVDLYSACLQRIKQTKILNAFITVPESVSLYQATQSMERFTSGQPLSCLDGIPISFKDNFSTKNVHTTCASLMLKNYIPPFDATVVEKLLKNAGSVMVGKTNMDEFAMGSACSESYFGPTYNPWNCSLKFKLQQQNSSNISVTETEIENDCEKWFIPGGSSGGSAVSVSVGASFAALSSDTGGSTRNPASRVGIVGFKPSYGVISRYGLIPLTHSLDVPGIMARNVDDVSIVFSHLHGIDHRDSTTVDIDLNNRLPVDKWENITVGIPDEYRCELLNQNIRQAWDEVVDMLSNCGARIQSISLPHTKHSLSCYSILNTCEVASNFACYDGIEYGHRTINDVEKTFEDCYSSSREESLNDIVKSRIIAGNYFLLNQNYQKYYQKALKLRRLIANDFEQAFKAVNFILTPVTLTSTMSYAKWNKMDKTKESINEDYCTQPANMAGLPAISVPVKLDDTNHNLPIGLQLIGPQFSDYRLLDIASKLETLVKFPQFIFDS